MTGLVAAVGLGANLQNPLEMLTEAVRLLEKEPELVLEQKSTVFLTEPVGGPPGQNWYHNQVCLFNTSLSPLIFLDLLLQTEAILGRVRKERWGPRIIDLDLLFMGDLVFMDSRLMLPHPRIAERSFVLMPLVEIAPDWKHPVSGQTPVEMLSSLPPDGPGIKKLA